MLPELTSLSSQFRDIQGMIVAVTWMQKARSPLPSPECKDMYILHLPQIFLPPAATYFFGSG